MSGDFHANSEVVLLRACLAGMGLCQLPMVLIEEYLKAGELEVVLEDFAKVSTDIYIVMPHRDMPEKVSFSGKVTRCDPPRLLAHTWVGGDENEEGESEVTYELEERGGDVLLTLTHRRITTREMMSGICGGWHTHLDIMIDVLNAREPQPFWLRHTALEAEYEPRLPRAG